MSKSNVGGQKKKITWVVVRLVMMVTDGSARLAPLSCSDAVQGHAMRSLCNEGIKKSRKIAALERSKASVE